MKQDVAFPDHLIDIQELNLAYLTLAQRLLQTNFKLGLFQMGLDNPTGELLSKLSVSQILQLAQTNTLISQFRISDYDLLKQLSTSSLPRILNNARTTIALLHRENHSQKLADIEG